jgi:ubiquinone/menaquinone biosynthesis C-methylase UbiE
MTLPPPGPDKALTRENWASRATYWDRRADQMADMADRLNQPLIEAASIEPGHRVLDLASGVGEPALGIARRVGEAGSVTATDLVPEMLAGSRRRAAEAKLGNIAFEIADMEEMTFEDESFDRVTCRFGLMFVPDPVRALGEARRVLVPEGRAAFMVWGPLEDTTNFRVFRAAAAEVFAADTAPPDFSTPFRLGQPGTLASLFEAAGFSAVEERELRFAPRVPADRAFWRPNLDMSLGPRLESATDVERRALEDAIRRHLKPYRDGAVYKLTAHIRIGLGTVA